MYVTRNMFLFSSPLRDSVKVTAFLELKWMTNEVKKTQHRKKAHISRSISTTSFSTLIIIRLWCDDYCEINVFLIDEMKIGYKYTSHDLIVTVFVEMKERNRNWLHSKISPIKIDAILHLKEPYTVYLKSRTVIIFYKLHLSLGTKSSPPILSRFTETSPSDNGDNENSDFMLYHCTLESVKYRIHGNRIFFSTCKTALIRPKLVKFLRGNVYRMNARFVRGYI